MTVAMPDISALNETEQRFITALYEVANNNPEFEYPREYSNPEWWLADSVSGIPVCRYYLANGDPACVWGNVFSKLEIPAESVPENKSIYEVFSTLKLDSRVHLIIIGLFGDFQSDQDYGKSWGDCLDNFDASLRVWLSQLDRM